MVWLRKLTVRQTKASQLRLRGLCRFLFNGEDSFLSRPQTAWLRPIVRVPQPAASSFYLPMGHTHAICWILIPFASSGVTCDVLLAQCASNLERSK